MNADKNRTWSEGDSTASLSLQNRIARQSEHQLQGELYDSPRFAGLNNRLRARRSDRRAAALSEDCAEDARRTDTGVHRMIEIRMVERVETLGAQLYFHSFRHLENLGNTEVDVPVDRTDEGVPADSIAAGQRDFESRSSEIVHIRHQRGGQHVGAGASGH